MRVKTATIDTMLSFYLAFLYTDRPYYNDDRILCMCEFLFQVQQKNRLKQKGLLRRFSVKCYGEQATLGSIRVEKAKKFQELKCERGSRAWNEWFLRYTPKSLEKTEKKKPQKTRKNTPKKKKSKKKTQKSRSIFTALKIF